MNFQRWASCFAGPHQPLTDAMSVEIVVDKGTGDVVLQQSPPGAEEYDDELAELISSRDPMQQTYGDVDDEESVAPELLSWRLDPSQSLSDWTLQVIVRGSIRVDFYNIHKSVVAVGPRQSAFFAHTFHKAAKKLAQLRHESAKGMAKAGPGRASPLQNDGMSVAPTLMDSIDPTKSSNRIELHRLAAESIPVVLDYMYSSEGHLDINTENASALHYLSQQLGMKSLRRASRGFWTQDVSMSNVTTYYAHARLFKDEKIIAHCVQHVAQHILDVDDTVVVHILTAVDPPFLLSVVKQIVEDHGAAAASLQLSLLVTVYGNVHAVELTPSMFEKLTDAELLPRLETKAATVLLDLENTITGNTKPTSLKSRAIEVLGEHWDEALVDRERHVTLPCLVGGPLEDFTRAVIKNAHERLFGDGNFTIPNLEARIAEVESRSPGQSERLLSLERRKTAELEAELAKMRNAQQSQDTEHNCASADLDQQLQDARDIIAAQKEQLQAQNVEKEKLQMELEVVKGELQATSELTFTKKNWATTPLEATNKTDTSLEFDVHDSVQITRSPGNAVQTGPQEASPWRKERHVYSARPRPKSEEGGSSPAPVETPCPSLPASRNHSPLNSSQPEDTPRKDSSDDLNTSADDQIRVLSPFSSIIYGSDLLSFSGSPSRMHLPDDASSHSTDVHSGAEPSLSVLLDSWKKTDASEKRSDREVEHQQGNIHKGTSMHWQDNPDETQDTSSSSSVADRFPSSAGSGTTSRATEMLDQVLRDAAALSPATVPPTSAAAKDQGDDTYTPRSTRKTVTAPSGQKVMLRRTMY